jgi:hypothetical protein
MSQTKVFSDQIVDPVQLINGATGTVTHDVRLGLIFNHTSIVSNFTPNFVNVPTTDNRAMTAILFLNQGSTGRYPSSVQVNSSAVTINWIGGEVPTPAANKKEVAAFTLLRVNNTWTVFGNYSSYG